MIHVVTKGGMGNQMFQYAFALQVQRLNQADTIYLNGGWHLFMNDKRTLSLGHFCLNDKVVEVSRVKRFFLLFSFFVATFRSLGLMASISFLKQHKEVLKKYDERLFEQGVYFTPKIYFVPQVRAGKGNKHLCGYYQSSAVVEGIEEQLKASFFVKTPASDANAKLLAEIESQNAVCLHVRRGDYRLFPLLQVCNEYYYYEAVKQAVAELESPVFYLFSTGHEDIEWVRQNYKFEADIRYVDMDNPDYEEIRLMMACKHFIISNSTFSWWAAVLSNRAENKRVWMPEEWLKGVDVQMGFPSWTIVPTHP